MNIDSKKKELFVISKEFDLELLVLFGSYSNNSFTQESDIDIAYYSKKPLDFKQKRELRFNLSKIFDLKEIDLIDLNSNYSILLRYEIFTKGLCLYESKEGLFEDFESNAWMDYQDNIDYLMQYKEIVRKSIESL